MKKIKYLVIITFLLCCSLSGTNAFAYEDIQYAETCNFDNTSSVEYGYNNLKNEVPNCRFCYAYDYDGDGLQEAFVLSGWWEEGIENGTLWFINSDGAYYAVEEGIYCPYELIKAELVYADQQIFFVQTINQNNKISSLIYGCMDGYAYQLSISKHVSSFHSESGHYYAYDLADYSGQEYLYYPQIGEFINIKNNVPDLDFNNMLDQDEWSIICYIFDRWYGDKSAFNNYYQLAYEFVLQQLCTYQNNYVENDPKGLLNFSYCYEANLVDSVLKTNFNMNDNLIENLHSNVYANQYGNVGYYYNNYYYFNHPEGTLQGFLYSIEIMEKKNNAYKVKFVNNDLSVYGIDNQASRDTYYCVFEVFNDGYKKSFKIYGISNCNDIEIPYNNIKVLLNDLELVFPQSPITENDRTLVPMRAIFEAMGATVEWNDNTQTITSKKGATTISLAIDSNSMHKNGATIYLDVPARLIGDYTMVPIRAVSEAFGADVTWDDNTQTVYITY